MHKAMPLMPYSGFFFYHIRNLINGFDIGSQLTVKQIPAFVSLGDIDREVCLLCPFQVVLVTQPFHFFF
jgi:hypothetical protein